MNWLAHLLLSKKHIDYQLGNFLADPLKGNTWEGVSQALKDGMQMHRAIDRFTDKHNVVKQSQLRLGKALENKAYLKGVVIDLLYDHYLANEWQLYSNISLDNFLSIFNREAMETSRLYPEEPKQIIAQLVKSNRLAFYADFDRFLVVLQRIDKHFSARIKRKDTLENYFVILEKEYDLLQSDFRQFFPDLMSFFKTHKLGSQQDHYLR